MCDSWKKKTSDELTLREIQSIFSHLPKMDFVRLSGGEPFLRRDLLDIVHEAQEVLKPICMHITTNGTLTDRIVKFCKNRRKDTLLYLLVSLDGLGETHNTIRGRKNAWSQTIETIRALAPHQKHLRLQIGINQTIVSEDGFTEYERLKNYLKPMGLQNNIVFAYKESSTYHADEDTSITHNPSGQFQSFGRFGSANLKTFFETIQNDLLYYPYLIRFVKKYYVNGIKNRLLHQTNWPNPICVALRSHLRLMPDGSLPTCQFNGTRIGDLRDQGFTTVWFGDKATQQRRWVDRCHGCWAECEVLPNAFYTGDIFRLFRNQRNK
jgi:MoaA/NifB/PqqE/SkfB family radical SAM enzyme